MFKHELTKHLQANGISKYRQELRVIENISIEDYMMTIEKYFAGYLPISSLGTCFSKAHFPEHNVYTPWQLNSATTSTLDNKKTETV